MRISRRGRAGSSRMKDGGCEGDGAKIGSGSSEKERAKTKATMSQGQAKLGKCARRQWREVELGAEGGED